MTGCFSRLSFWLSKKEKGRQSKKHPQLMLILVGKRTGRRGKAISELHWVMMWEHNIPREKHQIKNIILISLDHCIPKGNKRINSQFIRENSQILNHYVMVISSTFQAFLCLLLVPWENQRSLALEVGYGHVTCFGQWNGRRSNMCNFQPDCLITYTWFATLPCLLPQWSAAFQMVAAPPAWPLEWGQEQVNSQWESSTSKK